jgi:hypothetical protein
LDFDGSTNYVDILGENPIVSGTFSLTMWIYARDIPTVAKDYRMPLSNDSWVDAAIHVHITPETSIFKIDTKNGTDISSNTVIEAGQWYHVAGTLDAGGESKIYIDGILDNSAAGNAKEYIIGPANIGGYQNNSRLFNGMIDDVRIYNHILSEVEIQEILKQEQGVAGTPWPAETATDVLLDVTLSWQPGAFAHQHTVYLGTHYEDVNDADVRNPLGVLVSQGQDANSFDPGQLELDTTYYWRIDEANGAPDYFVHKGNVWSFTVEPEGIPITNVSATASGSVPGQGPDNTVNGSGLDDYGRHSTQGPAMWISGDGVNDTWIQYKFENVQKVHQMLVWNSNTSVESFVGFGIKEAIIEYSIDGTDWNTLGTKHEFAQAPGVSDYAHNTVVDFGGASAQYVRITTQSNWSGLLPQTGLSEVRFSAIPVQAREPNPSAGVSIESVDVTLTWRAGREASSHEVHMSRNQQALADSGTLVATVPDALYVSPALDYGATYYWQIVELNEAEVPATHTSDIWRFITPSYGTVEGFEIYSGKEGEEVFMTWWDGFGGDATLGGSTTGHIDGPFVETAIVHRGKQSMPVYYNNGANFVDIDGKTSSPGFSEVVREFNSPQDWTRSGVKTLGLWFHGAAGNTGQLYVKVNNVKVLYDGDAGNIALSSWQPWNIDLAASEANVQRVTSLTIGVDGTGSGVLYLDDIRLYAYSRKLITPVDPGNAGLVAHYKLDQNANDSSGNGHNGTVEGVPGWVSPGQDGTGSCKQFGSDGDRVTVESFDVTGTGITLAAWVHPISFMNDARMISKSEGGGTAFHYWAIVLSGTGENNLQFRLKTDVGDTTSRLSGGNALVADEWTHVAVAWDADDPVMRQYKNGQEIDSVNKAGSAVATGPGVKIGIGNQSISVLAEGPGNEIRPFDGLMDEVRLYERGLSPLEITYLAGRTQPFDKPF